VKAWKSKLGLWRGEIVTLESRKLEEFARNPHAHGVRSNIFVAGVTAAIPKKPGHRILVTGFQILAEYVNWLVHSSLSVGNRGQCTFNFSE